MKGGMKKGKWCKEEDNLIKTHIEKYGIGLSWQGLSNTLGLRRCGRSCRSRWLNYLRPGLKHGSFTPAEDRVICEMYRQRGSSWSVIAAELPGRTDLAIKNYWNSTLKKRFPRAARSRRRRRTSSTSSDATSLDLALVAYDEESTSGTARDLPPVGCNEEDSATATTAGHLPLVAYNVDEASAAGGSSSSHGGAVSAGSPAQDRAQPPPLPAAAAENEEPIAAVPVSGPVKMEPRTPPPPADETSEEMDVGCCRPMSPLPLGFMDEPDLPCVATMDEPDLPCIAMDLPHIAGFDDIDSLLSYFDH